jgi:hypothetical protein
VIILASLTYLAIERPFILLGQRLTKSILNWLDFLSLLTSKGVLIPYLALWIWIHVTRLFIIEFGWPRFNLQVFDFCKTSLYCLIQNLESIVIFRFHTLGLLSLFQQKLQSTGLI